jgi:hypothetical protein
VVKNEKKLPFQLFEHLSGDELKMAGVAVPSKVFVDPDDVNRVSGKVGVNSLNLLKF